MAVAEVYSKSPTAS